MDAEHVVILMQENRSFDHAYGTLQGVRGFNDPRAIDLPNKRKVWFQTNKAGQTFAPFRLNMKDTKATWMSALPHSWENQVDARNGGKYNGWLDAKRSGNKTYSEMPLTMGYYDREDIPFYYALADAFTICDQNFCSSLTGTTPNRLFLWTGTVRDPRDPKAMANVRNENVTYEREASWTTFPERLEDNGISWKIYQNELSLDTGLTGDEDGWLSNFTDNPIEWFSQYKVRFHGKYYPYIQRQQKELPDKIKAAEARLAALTEGQPEYAKAKRELDTLRYYVKIVERDLVDYAPEKYKDLPQRTKNLHEKAFSTNVNDPDYRSVTTQTYRDGDTERTMTIPKGDVLHQFRADVQSKKLPTVSWIVAPENFSDHPGAPWYGAWYISEVMDILTKDPEVWKKTIFILCYDENDGYFDHFPPFVPAHPNQPETGLNSKGLDTTLEFVTTEQESKRSNGGRTGPIGLGFRVPLVIASPWSRGGYVNSEVFDHTSILQFMEQFLSKKTGKTIKETNISDWRRTVCGDLTSVFRPYSGDKMPLPSPVQKQPFYEGIHKAQFKKLPEGFKALNEQEVESLKARTAAAPYYQEKGIRPSNALPYELYSDAKLKDGKLQLSLSAKNKTFGKKAAGSPFHVYEVHDNDVSVRHYTVAAGDTLTDSFSAEYPIRVYGPNGFFREFRVNKAKNRIDVSCLYNRGLLNNLSGDISLQLANADDARSYTVQIIDNGYGAPTKTITLAKAGTKGAEQLVELDLKRSHNWYDVSVKIDGIDDVEFRYAGRVETGKTGYTDPLIGQGPDTLTVLS